MSSPVTPAGAAVTHSAPVYIAPATSALPIAPAVRVPPHLVSHGQGVAVDVGA